MSALIAKGRRTVLKISPPKNPHYYEGTPSRKLDSHRRREGEELPLRWQSLPLTRRFRYSLRPSEPAPLCGGVSRCVLGIPSSGCRHPPRQARPRRRIRRDNRPGSA